MKIKSLFFICFTASTFYSLSAKPNLFGINIMGTVTGLQTGQSIILFDTQDSHKPSLTLQNGSFIYPNSYSVGESYYFSVTTSDGEYCDIVHGNGGPLYDNVNNVQINCNSSGNLFITIGQQGQILFSIDGSNWNRSSNTISSTLNDALVTGNSSFSVIGAGGTFYNFYRGWNQRNVSVNTAINSIALYTNTASNKLFVIVGDNGLIETSSDSVIWNLQSYSKPINILQVINCNNNFYAVADFTNLTTSAIISSNSQAVTWSSVFSSNTGQSYNSLACFSTHHNDTDVVSSIIFATGNNGSLIKSTDGINWTSSTIASGLVFNQILSTVGGTLYVVGATLDGRNGVIYQSRDAGASWSRVSTPTNFSPLNSIAINTQGVVVVIGGNNIYTSSDNMLTWRLTYVGVAPLNKVRVLR